MAVKRNYTVETVGKSTPYADDARIVAEDFNVPVTVCCIGPKESSVHRNLKGKVAVEKVLSENRWRMIYVHKAA